MVFPILLASGSGGLSGVPVFMGFPPALPAASLVRFYGCVSGHEKLSKQFQNFSKISLNFKEPARDLLTWHTSGQSPS